MASDDSSIADLLRGWHAGVPGALEALIRLELPWIREHVHHRLGDLLRARGETADYVHDALVEVLRYAPRFVTADRARFRSLLARIIENVLRDRHDWYTAKRRALCRERPLPSGSVLDLDLRHDSVTRPSQEAVRHEREAMVRLALELLDPDDRKVILLRQWDELPFAEIAAQTGFTEDAARMRFRRALPKLAEKVAELFGDDVEPPPR
jgi:RNA polymerase sigma-70 factor (ECF subfamily)